MGRFDPKYSREQKDAAIRALVEERILAPDVVRLAAAGQLEGLEPFDLNVETARFWRAKEQRKRGLKADYHNLDAEANLEAIANDCAAWLRRHLGRSLTKRDPTNADIERIKRLSQAGREVQALARGVGRQTGAKPTKQRESEPTNEVDNVTRMMRALDARTEPNGPTPKHSVEDEATHPRSSSSADSADRGAEVGSDAVSASVGRRAKQSA